MAGGRASEMMIQGGLDKILNIGSAGIQAFSQTVAGYTYLLLDRFTTNASAPLASPRTCEPGPGTLTITDPANAVRIVGSELKINGTLSGVTWVSGPSHTVAVGKAWFFSLPALTTIPSNLFRIQLDTGSQAPASLYIRPASTTTISIMSGGATIDTLTLGAAPWYFGMVERSDGSGYLLWRNSTSNPYTLLWVWSGTVAGNKIPTLMNLSGSLAWNFTTDDWRLIDLSAVNAVWATDWGIATTRLSGARSAGDTYTHVANCLIEYTATTKPSAGNVDVVFRKQDASNYWIARINSSGDLSLQEVVAGTPTQRGNAAAVISNGHRVVIIADGSTIKGYSNNTLRWTYASATSGQTATAGVLNDLGTGGACSEIIAWPRDVSAYIPANV